MRKLAEFIRKHKMVRVYRDREWNEYVVRFYSFVGDCGWSRLDDAEYRTDDRSDAMGTARVWVDRV